MMELSQAQQFSMMVIPGLFAITLHEVAHGWIASFFGDQTARLSGRLTINPIKHIDPVGTVLLPIMTFYLTGYIFGYAKPVPVDPRNMRHPRRDMAFTALAGPVSNLLMAVFWACIAKLAYSLGDNGNEWFTVPLYYMGSFGVQVNVVLAVLNLLPLPPLDGGNVLLNILPRRMAYRFSLIEPYGFIILILLMVSGILTAVMMPIVLGLIIWFRMVFGI